MYLFNVYIQYIVYFGAMHLLLDIWICIVYLSVVCVFGEEGIVYFGVLCVLVRMYCGNQRRGMSE